MNETKSAVGDRKALVAVVDDDESVREATEALLRCAGYRAEGFDSAEEFLISGRLPVTDCLILDVKMPGMGGMALRGMLDRHLPAVPTVFLTAHGDETTRRQAMKLGAAAFLRKPYSAEDLLDKVRISLEVNHLASI